MYARDKYISGDAGGVLIDNTNSNTATGTFQAFVAITDITIVAISCPSRVSNAAGFVGKTFTAGTLIQLPCLTLTVGADEAAYLYNATRA